MTTAFKQISGYAVTAIIALLLIIFIPLQIIWALNELFPALAIEYSVSTWFASLTLIVVLNKFFLKGSDQ
jgi:hypothetical protein